MLRPPGAWAFSPTPSVASPAGSALKRQRTSQPCRPHRRQCQVRSPTMGSRRWCDGLRARRTSAADRHLSLEAECFSPILVEVNQTRRKVCSAIERLCALLVEMPSDQILAASPAAFATAPLQEGADESAFAEDRAAMASVGRWAARGGFARGACLLRQYHRLHAAGHRPTARQPALAGRWGGKRRGARWRGSPPRLRFMGCRPAAGLGRLCGGGWRGARWRRPLSSLSSTGRRPAAGMGQRWGSGRPGARCWNR
jgi:hypothetical protein